VDDTCPQLIERYCGTVVLHMIVVEPEILQIFLAPCILRGRRVLPVFTFEVSAAATSSPTDTAPVTMEFNEKKADKVLGVSDAQNGSLEAMHATGVLPDHNREETYESGVTKDGMRLHPQPTSDPLDPLNWSSFKKHVILSIVMWK